MKKILICTLLLALASVPAALAEPPTHGCDQANENDGDPYDSTCDGSPSENGNGGGNATGKPCEGCVGAADNKNPKGQLPDGTDPNNGYECDGNNGVGKGNPAHTSCDPYSRTAPGGTSKKISGAKASFADPLEPKGESMPTGAMLVAFVMLGVLALGTTRVVARRTRDNDPKTGLS